MIRKNSMNRTPDFSVNFWQLSRHAEALVISLLTALYLTACGPGTGGTGVGPRAILGTYVSAFSGGTASAPVTVTLPGLATGVAPSVVLSASPDANFVVVFEAERVTLTNACLVFSSQGARIESDGQLQIDGGFQINAPGSKPATGAALPATLVARTDGTGLQVTLRTPEGSVLASFGTSAPLPQGISPVSTGACVAKAG